MMLSQLITTLLLLRQDMTFLVGMMYPYPGHQKIQSSKIWSTKTDIRVSEPQSSPEIVTEGVNSEHISNNPSSPKTFMPVRNAQTNAFISQENFTNLSNTLNKALDHILPKYKQDGKRNPSLFYRSFNIGVKRQSAPKVIEEDPLDVFRKIFNESYVSPNQIHVVETAPLVLNQGTIQNTALLAFTSMFAVSHEFTLSTVFGAGFAYFMVQTGPIGEALRTIGDALFYMPSNSSDFTVEVTPRDASISGVFILSLLSSFTVGHATVPVAFGVATLSAYLAQTPARFGWTVRNLGGIAWSTLFALEPFFSKLGAIQVRPPNTPPPDSAFQRFRNIGKDIIYTQKIPSDHLLPQAGRTAASIIDMAEGVTLIETDELPTTIQRSSSNTSTAELSFSSDKQLTPPLESNAQQELNLYEEEVLSPLFYATIVEAPIKVHNFSDNNVTGSSHDSDFVAKRKYVNNGVTKTEEDNSDINVNDTDTYNAEESDVSAQLDHQNNATLIHVIAKDDTQFKITDEAKSTSLKLDHTDIHNYLNISDSNFTSNKFANITPETKESVFDSISLGTSETILSPDKNNQVLNNAVLHADQEYYSESIARQLLKYRLKLEAEERFIHKQKTKERLARNLLEQRLTDKHTKLNLTKDLATQVVQKDRIEPSMENNNKRSIKCNESNTSTNMTEILSRPSTSVSYFNISDLTCTDKELQLPLKITGNFVVVPGSKIKATNATQKSSKERFEFTFGPKNKALEDYLFRQIDEARSLESVQYAAHEAEKQRRSKLLNNAPLDTLDTSFILQSLDVSTSTNTTKNGRSQSYARDNVSSSTLAIEHEPPDMISTTKNKGFGKLVDTNAFGKRSKKKRPKKVIANEVRNGFSIDKNTSLPSVRNKKEDAVNSTSNNHKIINSTIHNTMKKPAPSLVRSDRSSNATTEAILTSSLNQPNGFQGRRFALVRSKMGKNDVNATKSFERSTQEIQSSSSVVPVFDSESKKKSQLGLIRTRRDPFLETTNSSRNGFDVTSKQSTYMQQYFTESLAKQIEVHNITKTPVGFQSRKAQLLSSPCVDRDHGVAYEAAMPLANVMPNNYSIIYDSATTAGSENKTKTIAMEPSISPKEFHKASQILIRIALKRPSIQQAVLVHGMQHTNMREKD